nr:catalase [Paenibacillus kobensis]
MNEHRTANQGVPVGEGPSIRTDGQHEAFRMGDGRWTGKPQQLDRERIAERGAQARGAGARGVFVTEHSMAAYTKAHFIQKEGQETAVFARFSSVMHGQGSPETARDPRGFAVKFYTQDGIYDIVGSHLPVSFARDAAKLSDMLHAIKLSPDMSEQMLAQYWDYMTRMPETTHMLTWLFSNDGTPANYRQMNGYGVHPFQWTNAEGKRTYIKYHWRSKQGTANFTPPEAAEMQANDFSHATRDLYAAIELGGFPQWELHVQLLKPEEKVALPFDPLDPTKIWPEDQFPLVKVGTMTLNQNPVSYFTEVERSVFAPSALVPGIDASEPSEPDCGQPRMQQAQAFDDDSEDSLQSPARGGYAAGADDFTQAGQRYRTLPEEECEWLIQNLSGELRQVPQQTQLLAVCNFFRADIQFGSRLAAGLGIDLGKHVPRS